ncbi:hypothetical protein NDU88_004340 [Pleurodeles waltl]|uniref:Uncharacterized protein n=1 Tax=Pleurodeles waltl TaxID=8319 RepID=A0AAV7TR02_PLEWA|nr:hypothetical protein NDU88_004340 [Pleurodeles waltl]
MFRLPFETRPWTVTAVKGTMIMARRGPETVTRNAAFFKRLPQAEPIENDKDSTDEWAGSDVDTAGPESTSREAESASEHHTIHPTVEQMQSQPTEATAPNQSAEEIQVSDRSGRGRYMLRHNPGRSRRYADYACD